jgi:SMODS and SLOG-associating 2TM effector domain 2
MANQLPNSKDLLAAGFPVVVWDGTQDIKSLEALRTFLVSKSEEASNWYLRNRWWKRFWGQNLRLLAMTATTVAGILPILSQIFISNGQSQVAPAWGSVALALAAGFVGLDYYFGFSSGWMRYMETDQKIIHALREFQFDWEALRAGWGAHPPSSVQVLAALSRLKQFGLLVQQLVEDETNAWIAEFRSTLRMMDEAARSKSEPAARAGLNVLVANGPQVTGDWSLSIDDGTPTTHRGGRAALVNLIPGPHKVKIEGIIGGQTVRDEVTTIVPATGVGETTLTLR